MDQIDFMKKKNDDLKLQISLINEEISVYRSNKDNNEDLFNEEINKDKLEDKSNKADGNLRFINSNNQL